MLEFYCFVVSWVFLEALTVFLIQRLQAAWLHRYFFCQWTVVSLVCIFLFALGATKVCLVFEFDYWSVGD